MLKNQGRFKKKILTMHGAVKFERTMLIGIDKENTKKLLPERMDLTVCQNPIRS